MLTKKNLLSVWLHKGPSIFNLGLSLMICSQDEPQDSPYLFVTKSVPVQSVHLKPFLFQYCGSLLGRTFCKTTVGDFICSSILPCDHAFIQPFQGTLCCACSVLEELLSLNACRAFYDLLCPGALHIVLLLV